MYQEGSNELPKVSAIVSSKPLRRKEDLLELVRQDAKQEFEAGRNKIMDQVPDAYKQMSSADPPEDDEVADEIQPNKKNETATIEKSEAAMLRRKEDLLELSRQDAKQEFEAGRKRVMDQVPDAYKQMFGQAGFGKWGKHILPVLIMSPYDVSMGEGSPREQWLGMFERVSSLVRNH
jgi:hypothetical protein